MQWAPFEYSPDVRSFSQDQVFDFGETVVDFGKFEVSYHKQQGGAFRGNWEAGKCRRYVFRITADNYVRSKLFTVEVRVRKFEPTEGWPYQINTGIEIVS